VLATLCYVHIKAFFSGNCMELGTCMQKSYRIVNLESELECDLEVSNCTGIESMH